MCIRDSFTIFDGEKDISVKTVKEDATQPISEGTVIVYTEDGDAIDVSTTYEITATLAGAITKYNGSDEISFVAGNITESITGANKDVINKSGTAYANVEIDEDTVIICVDNDDHSGIPGGTLALATETPAGNYYANVLALMSNNNTHADLIVFGNDILNVM